MPLAPVLVLLMAAFPFTSSAGPEEAVRSGFSTGEKYLKMTSAQKRYFSMGLVNGMLVAPLFGAPKEKMATLEDCITGMTDTQTSAILTSYLEKNPAVWNQTPHVSMYTALMNACAKNPAVGKKR